jgi:hypothetical protein
MKMDKNGDEDVCVGVCCNTTRRKWIAAGIIYVYERYIEIPFRRKVII